MRSSTSPSMSAENRPRHPWNLERFAQVLAIAEGLLAPAVYQRALHAEHPRSSTTRLPGGQGRTSLLMQESAGRDLLGIAAVESGGEAKVGPSCGIHLGVQKHFDLAAAR